MSVDFDAFPNTPNAIKVSNGHYVDLLNTDPSSIEIDSIAGALSKICRFGGHCPRFYSVAEHSILAAQLATQDGLPLEASLAVLLHDATEAYLGDMVRPLKAVMPQYREAESRMEQAIQIAFDVDFSRWKHEIKFYDLQMLRVEKREFWPDDTKQWGCLDGVRDCGANLLFLAPQDAYELFLTKWHGLFDDVYCHPCSESGNADRPIYHKPPACP